MTLTNIANPSVVCNIRAPTQGVETFGNISPPFCTLAILSPPCKILQRSSQGNPFIGSAKCKRGSIIERCHVRVSHLLMSFLFTVKLRSPFRTRPVTRFSHVMDMTQCTFSHNRDHPRRQVQRDGHGFGHSLCLSVCLSCHVQSLTFEI